jgi:hypothetical protein
MCEAVVWWTRHHAFRRNQPELKRKRLHLRGLPVQWPQNELYDSMKLVHFVFHINAGFSPRNLEFSPRRLAVDEVALQLVLPVLIITPSWLYSRLSPLVSLNVCDSPDPAFDWSQCKDLFKARSQNCEKRQLTSSYLSIRPSVRPSVCPSAWNNSAPAGRIFMKFDFWGFFETLSRKYKLDSSMTRITDTLHEYICTLRSCIAELFLEREMFRRNVVEKTKTHILCSITFFQKSCRFACWMTKATNTHSEYVILIVFHDNNGYANAPHSIALYVRCPSC